MKLHNLFWCTVSLIFLSACTLSNLDEGNQVNVNTDPGKTVQGVWKVEGFRLGGANLMDVNPLGYIAIDEENAELAIINKSLEASSDFPYFETFNMDLSESEITIYRQGSEIPENRFEYHLSSDRNTLFIYPKAVSFVNPSLLDDDEVDARLSITLARDADLETRTMARASQWRTKGFWDYIKMIPSLLGILDDIVEEIVENSIEANFIDPYVPVTNVVAWGHSLGWKGDSWMSLLDKDMPVCEVNIPGSHDSATATKQMGADAVAVSADCQTYLIPEQYALGARYFDLRVGNEFRWETPLITKRLPNQQEIDATEDLYLYHGNFSTGTKYKETLLKLAELVQSGDKTEFVFVSTQWEDLSYGLIDKANMFIDDKLGIGGGNVQGYFVNELKNITLDIANRIQKEVNEHYNGDLFINYSPDLTVEKARGHIILMIQSHGEANALANSQCSYVYNWPDKNIGYSYLASYEKCYDDKRLEQPGIIVRNGRGYNAYVQSDYEMRIYDDVTIDMKKEHMRMVADSTTIWNMFQGKHILGFNAMNANGGAVSCYDLDVYEFAHKFNGEAVNLYTENMLNSRGIFRFHSGIVTMDHLGAKTYDSAFRTSLVDVYGDLLVWAVIESNFN